MADGAMNESTHVPWAKLFDLLTLPRTCEFTMRAEPMPLQTLVLTTLP